MTYKQNVKAAAVALKIGEDANWELARLTFENTKGANGKGQPGQVTMTEWCADVVKASGRKFSATTGKLYKVIWGQFGSRRTADSKLSWSESYWAATGKDKDTHLAELVTRRDAVKLASGTPEQKRETFRQLAADRDVVSHPATAKVLGKILHENPATTKAVMDEPVARTAVFKAQNQRAVEQSDRIKKNLEDKGFPEFITLQTQAAEAAEFVNVTNLLHMARHKIAEAVQACVRLNLGEGQRMQVQSARDGIALAMDYLDSYLSGDKSTLEDELAKLMAEGEL